MNKLRGCPRSPLLTCETCQLDRVRGGESSPPPRLPVLLLVLFAVRPTRTRALQPGFALLEEFGDQRVHGAGLFLGFLRRGLARAAGLTVDVVLRRSHQRREAELGQLGHAVGVVGQAVAATE